MSEKKDEKKPEAAKPADPKPDPPRPAVQTDEELSALAKINRLLLKLDPPARQRAVAWLHGRHKESA